VASQDGLGFDAGPQEPWAKTSSSGDRRSIIEHCVDVAATFRLLISGAVVSRRLAAAFNWELGEVHLDRLTVLAGLHDFGKASKGFQDKLFGSSIVGHTGHVSEALALLIGDGQIQSALGMEMLAAWFEPVTDAVYTAVCHHGAPVEDRAIQAHLAVVPQLLLRTVLGHLPAEQIERLLAALLSIYPDAATGRETPKLTFTTEAQHLFAGLLMTADWMASGFAFEPGTSQRRAEALLDATVWRDWWNSRATPLGLLGDRTPRASQAAFAELSLDERLVVLEAPTGTGKTEAALIWASRLVEAGLVDGLYFAVPTRSAATELHERVGRLMASAHPKLRGKVVRAIPGMLDVDDVRPDYPAESWAVAAPKRVFAAPVAVGTIDQALLSAVKTRHAWMRAAMLSRHLLVVDEVHASDRYMASLTTALVSRHLNLGGYALAMSATLGETALAQLQGRSRLNFDSAVAAPYPAIRTSFGVLPLGATTDRTTRIVFEPHRNAAEIARQAVMADGQKVLWLRGTVRDAVSDFEMFEALGVPSMLHHSHYAVDDRSWLDDQLMSVFGVNGSARPVVAVTTQTAEQSLDIDADLLVTDACPADVLLQRLGRLHRHRSGTIPTAIIIEPGRDLGIYISEKGLPHGTPEQGWPWVYRNLPSVRATMDWIREHEEIVVPRDSRELVELATHADRLRNDAMELGGRWERLWSALYSKGALNAATADAGVVDWQRPYRDALVLEAIATRLGEGTLSIAVDSLRSPFTGYPITAIPVPRRWLPDGDLPEVLRGAAVGDQIEIDGTALIYDRFGLRPA